MATSFIFNGKKVYLPGIYSAIKSGIKNPPANLDYGKVLIVDTGSGAGWGFGAGVLGELANQDKAVYSGILDQGSMKALMKGGLWWKLAEPLFKPDGVTSTGVSEIEFVKAATTTAATISYTFQFGITNTQTLVTVTTTASGVSTAQVNTLTVGAAIDEGDVFTIVKGATTLTYTALFGDTPAIVALALKNLVNASSGFNTVVTATNATNTVIITANAVNTPFTQTSSASNTVLTSGALAIKTRDEGIVGNGVTALSGTLLTQGYAGIFSAGINDPTKFIMSIYLGSYKGLDPINSVPYDNITDINTLPSLVIQSPEVSTLTQIVSWMTTDTGFNSMFKLASSTIGEDNFVPSDIINSGGLILASGGTETYSSAAFDAILDIVADHNYSMILSDQYNSNVASLYNEKFAYHINNEAKYDKFLYIGGGNDASTYQTNSKAAAISYNLDNVHVVHGGALMSSTSAPTGFYTYDSIFKAAAIVGRIAGLPPQVPPTFKSIGISGERHLLKKKEQEDALKSGILYTIYDTDFNKFTIGQGINTLQTNSNFINDDGTSYSIQIMRIAAQLNKEIIVNAKIQLFGDPNGVNQSTLSTQTVKDWLVGYLKRKVANASAGLDNLIISYDPSSITVVLNGDAYFVTYKFKPNGEINKAFFTGFMIN